MEQKNMLRINIKQKGRQTEHIKTNAPLIDVIDLVQELLLSCTPDEDSKRTSIEMRVCTPSPKEGSRKMLNGASRTLSFKGLPPTYIKNQLQEILSNGK